MQERHRQCIATRADIRASIVQSVLVLASDAPPEEIAPAIERLQDRLQQTIPDREC